MPSNKLGKRIFSSKPLLIVSILVLIFFTVSLTKVIINRQDLIQDIDQLEQESQGLNSRNQELTQLIEYFKSIDFVETEARTKLNLRKPGEKILIVPGAEQTAAETDTGDKQSMLITAQSQDRSNLQKWWDYFFVVK